MDPSSVSGTKGRARFSRRHSPRGPTGWQGAGARVSAGTHSCTHALRGHQGQGPWEKLRERTDACLGKVDAHIHVPIWIKYQQTPKLSCPCPALPVAAAGLAETTRLQPPSGSERAAGAKGARGRGLLPGGCCPHPAQGRAEKPCSGSVRALPDAFR